MVRKSLVSLLLVIVWSGLPLLFATIDATGSGLDKQGLSVIFYSILRTLSAVGIFLCITSTGALFLGLVDRTEITFDPFSRLLCSFGIGAALLAFLFFGIGLLGLLYTATALVITVPLIAATPFLLKPLLRSCFESIKETFNAYRTFKKWAVGAVVLLNLACAIYLLALRVLFPSEIDGDVWEHYLHYFNEVANSTHSVWPGEIWYQFFISKGATLQILAVLLGDILAPQLVSWCFIVFIALIAYEISYRLTGKGAWSLLSSLSVLQLACILQATPNFLKPHAVLAALIIFLCWCIIRLVQSPSTLDRSFLLGGIFVAAYMGVYIPVAGFIFFAGGFTVLFIIWIVRRTIKSVLNIVFIIIAALVGTSATLLFNYSITGMALDTPVKFFWDHADQARFSSLWDPFIIRYWFLGIGAVEATTPSIGQMMNINLGWFTDLVRSKYLDVYPRLWGGLALVSVLTLVFRRHQEKNIAPANPRPLSAILLVSLLIGYLAPANLFPGSDSIYRLYAFAGFLAIILSTAFAILLSGPILANRVLDPLALIAIAGAITWSMLSKLPFERNLNAYDYLTGKLTTGQVFTLNDKYSDLPGGFQNFMAAKRAATGGGKIVYLGYSPSPGYLLPSPALITEPSYAFGSYYGEILYGAPYKAEAAFRSLGVEYFLINMRSRLFLGIPYSPLFDTRTIRDHFELKWNNNEFFLLTWKGKGGQPLPDDFLAILEFKQKSIFARVRGEFIEVLRAATYKHDGINTSACQAEVLLAKYLLGIVESIESRSFVRDFLAQSNISCSSTINPKIKTIEFLASNATDSLYIYSKKTWGNDIATDMWNLRLSKDIKSQDFGWLYEKNAAYYKGHQAFEANR
jgi:hypothetical protein